MTACCKISTANKGGKKEMARTKKIRAVVNEDYLNNNNLLHDL